MKIPEVYTRIAYFFFGFFLSLVALILFVRLTGWNRPTNYPVLVIRHHTIHDTIPPEGFQSIELPDTLPFTASWVWRLWTYEDTILRVQFESPAFRNFQYWLTLPAPVITGPEIIKQQVSLSLTTNWSNANLLLGYKNVAFGVQYGWNDHRFYPLLGFHFSF